MENKSHNQTKNWFQSKISKINNNTPTFLKVLITINVFLLLALLIVTLIIYFLQPQNQGQETNKNIFTIPDWLIFVLTFLGSIFNLLSIVMMHFKKKSSFIWGLLAVICFGFYFLKSKLWGQVIIYWGYYVITQILLFFWWTKKINTDKQIITKHTKLWEFILICFILLAISIGLMFMQLNILKIQEWLNEIGTNDTKGKVCLFLDSFIMVFTLSFVYFVAKRYIERWIVSIIINCAQIILFTIQISFSIMGNNLIEAINGINMLLSTITLFAIAIYSWIIWNKDYDKNK